MKKVNMNPMDGVANLAMAIRKEGDKQRRTGDVIDAMLGFLFFLFFVFLAIGITQPADVSLAAQESNKSPEFEAASTFPALSDEKTSECPLRDSLEGYDESWDKVLSYCSEITNASEQYEVDPKVIAAIILMESGGDASAISTSGAVGLMQIMPSDGIASTYSCINGPCFADRPKTDELLNPEFNINFGTNILKEYVSAYGNLREALYHYGPMDVGYEGYADVIISLAEKLSE